MDYSKASKSILERAAQDWRDQQLDVHLNETYADYNDDVKPRYTRISSDRSERRELSFVMGQSKQRLKLTDSGHVDIPAFIKGAIDG